MKLNDPLVTSFIYKDQEYDIDLSFDTVLDVFDVLEDKKLRDYEKAEINVELLLGESFELTEAVEIWNYIYESFIEFKSKKPVEYDLKGNPMPVIEDDEDERHLDINHDAEYIYSSFQQAYGMNLYEQQGKLHWHEFKALLNGLPSNTIMQRIIQIRSWKPSKGDSGEYKQQMRELQKVYALPEVEEVEE
uniref:bacteriophage Gp15 family protein n=1 Tax=uncultured Allobacillus sp. TaxID=1638025 RepID=UPI00259A80E7|nr:bacteriophage Gp15 family protein [uncultured Allobacillus sp.]